MNADSEIPAAVAGALAMMLMTGEFATENTELADYLVRMGYAVPKGTLLAPTKEGLLMAARPYGGWQAFGEGPGRE